MCTTKESKKLLRNAVKNNHLATTGKLLLHGVEPYDGIRADTNKDNKGIINADILVQIHQAFRECLQKDTSKWNETYDHIVKNHFPPHLGGNDNATKSRFRADYLAGTPEQTIRNLLQHAHTLALGNYRTIEPVSVRFYEQFRLRDYQIGLHQAWKIVVNGCDHSIAVVLGIRDGHMKIVTAYPIRL